MTMFTLNVTVFAAETLALRVETVIVKLPTGAPVGLPLVLPLPLPQPDPQRATAIRQNAARDSFHPFRLPNGSRIPARANVEVTAHKLFFPEFFANVPLVFRVSVTFDGCTPSGVTCAGLKLHVTFVGRVPQVNCTACEKPPSGNTLSVAVPVCPSLMVSAAGAPCTE